MAIPHNTRLREISAKDRDLIYIYVNKLPYRIEIKGGIGFDPKKKRFYLTFVLPDNDKLVELPSGDLD